MSKSTNLETQIFGHILTKEDKNNLRTHIEVGKRQRLINQFEKLSKKERNAIEKLLINDCDLAQNDIH